MQHPHQKRLLDPRTGKPLTECDGSRCHGGLQTVLPEGFRGARAGTLEQAVSEHQRGERIQP